MLRQAPLSFDDFAKRTDDELDPVLGAVLIAGDFANAPVDPAQIQASFEALARPLLRTAWTDRSLEDQANALREELASSHGFVGDEDDYYDPQNSFLQTVLERKRGIPISLALVYIEVARRAGMLARGVGFPGHFLVRIDRDLTGSEPPVFIDAFFGGRIATKAVLGDLLARTGASGTDIPEALLAPISSRALLQRMLMNLRNVFLHRGEFGKALLVVDRVLALSPMLAEAIFDRGLISERAGLIAGARASFEEYLEKSPSGPNRKAAENRLRILRARTLRSN